MNAAAANGDIEDTPVEQAGGPGQVRGSQGQLPGGEPQWNGRSPYLDLTRVLTIPSYRKTAECRSELHERCVQMSILP